MVDPIQLLEPAADGELPRPRLISEVYYQLRERLGQQGIMIDEYLIIEPHVGTDDRIPKDFLWFACYAVQGGSEGYYIHVDARLRERTTSSITHVPLFLGKTFMGEAHAWEIARACARILG